MNSIIKKILFSKIFLIFIGLCLIYLGISTVKETYKRYTLKKEISRLKQKINSLEEKNNKLKELISYFDKESFLEKQARIKLNLKKPGEKVIIIPEPQKEKQEHKEILPKKELKDVSEPNWKKWWNYFFKNNTLLRE